MNALSYSVALVLAAAGLGFAVLPDPAIAGESRTNGSRCFGNDRNSNFGYYANDGYKNTRVVAQSVYCPFVDDNSSVPRPGLTTLSVHGDRPSASTAVYASACVKYWNASGYECGTSASTSSVGYYSLSPSLTKWNGRPSDFAFVWVELSTLATVAGYFAIN